MAKMNIGMASMQIKGLCSFMEREECWCNFITKVNDGATSMQMQVLELLH